MAQFSFIRAGACIRDRMKYRSLIRTGAFMRHVVTAPATSHAGPPPPSQGMSEALSSGERSDNPRESGREYNDENTDQESIVIVSDCCLT